MLRQEVVCSLVVVAVVACNLVGSVDILELYGHGMKRLLAARKRAMEQKDKCPEIKPFNCPAAPGEPVACLPLQYICDGSEDCDDGYDENRKLCTAAIRPPVEETVNFLSHLIQQNGPDFLTKLFGPKAKDALEPMGGVEAVAVALSESKTIEDFGKVLHLMGADVDHLRTILAAVDNDEPGVLRSMGIKDSIIGDLKFFLEKLVKTGFLNK